MTNGSPSRSTRAARYFDPCSEASSPSSPSRRSSSARPARTRRSTIRNTLSGGRRGGVATAGGVALGLAIWTVAASVGVVALLSASEPAFRALRLAGAAYLVFLAASRSSLPRAVVRPRRAQRSADDAATRPAPGRRQQPRKSEDRALLREPAPAVRPGGQGGIRRLPCLGFLFSAMTLAWLSLYAVVVAAPRDARGTVRGASTPRRASSSSHSASASPATPGALRRT